MPTAPPDSAFRCVLLSLAELPIALGVAFSTFVLFSLAGCKWAHCVDLSGIPWYLGGALLGLTAGTLYWVTMLRLRERLWRRFVTDGVAILVAVLGWVVPHLVR